MGDRINEIKLDIEDLNSLLKSATRQKSQDLIGLEIRKLQSELINWQKQTGPNNENNTLKANSHSLPKCYDIKLNNYAWDQTDEFVKLYVTLNNVHSLQKEAVYCHFSERSINLHIIGLENKNYQLPINNLCEDINEKKSYVKVKTDMVIVYLSKKARKTWKCVTSVEKSLKESKSVAPSPSDTEDPNASIMNLMKKMYQEGDDEMKKTIAKAWTESQEKKLGMNNLPEL